MTPTRFAFVRDVLAARRHRRQYAREIDRIEIVESGVDDQGYAYVQLADGVVLFSRPTPGRMSRVHGMLSGKQQRAVVPEAVQAAFDAAVRYEGGGLRWGGPQKQSAYKVRPGDVVVEMGAFLGHYALRLSRDVGPAGRVLSIEPHPGNLPILRQNIRANRATNVRIDGRGVWSRRGRSSIHVRGDDFQSSSLVLADPGKQRIEIEVAPLDEILSDARVDRVDLMIIQLNGAEPEALEGLTGVAPQNLAMASRYSPGGESTTPRIVRLLESRGYQVRVVEDAFVFAHVKPSDQGGRPR